MNERSISISRLDDLTRMLADQKKVIAYDKSAGTWSWVDKDCVDNTPDYHVGFATWLDAVVDTLNPYIVPRADENIINYK